MEAADRRVRRSRSALMRAAVSLVAERGTTNITVSDIAETADVSRQLVYQQFGDRDSLLLAAALDLAATELVPRITQPTVNERARGLAAGEHFARHRPFYRAMLTGPCAFALTKVLSDLLSPFNEHLVRRMSTKPLTEELVADLTVFVTGGWAAILNTWVIEGPDPLDPEELTDRLLRMLPVISAGSTTHEPDESSHPARPEAGSTGHPGSDRPA